MRKFFVLFDKTTGKPIYDWEVEYDEQTVTNFSISDEDVWDKFEQHPSVNSAKALMADSTMNGVYVYEMDITDSDFLETGELKFKYDSGLGTVRKKTAEELETP